MISYKHITKITLLVVFLLVLSGCWDREEAEKKAFVVAIGIDKAKNDSRIKVTYLISNPEYATDQSGGSTNEPSFQSISVEANDFISSRDTANIVIAKEIAYDILRTIVISEDFARDKNFIRWMYDAAKDTEIRRDIQFIVTKEETSEYFRKNEPRLETRIHDYFELILDRGNKIAILPKPLLMHYFRITEANADLLLASYSSIHIASKPEDDRNEDEYIAGDFHFEGQTNRTNFIGSAVFKGGQMIGKLNGEETRLTIMLNNTMDNPDILATYRDPFNKNYLITIKINKPYKNVIEMKLNETVPKINVTVPITVDVLTNHSMTNYVNDEKKKNILKNSIKEQLTAKMEKLIKKTQDEFKGQPFGWSLEARKKFLTISEYEAYNWMEKYPSMKVSVNVDITFGNFGRQSLLPNLKDLRD